MHNVEVSPLRGTVMGDVAVSHRDRLLRIVLYLRDVGPLEPDGASTRSQIVTAAMSLFTKKGYAGTSMREIAAAVGIRAASLYAHCPEGKEQLLKVGLTTIFNRFLAYVTHDVGFDMSAVSQLRSVVQRHVTWQLDFGEQALAWDAAINQFGVAGVLDESTVADVRMKQALYHDYFDALVGAAKTSDVDAADAGTAVRVLCDRVHDWLPTRVGEQSEILTEHKELVVGRIQALVDQLLQLPSPYAHQS